MFSYAVIVPVPYHEVLEHKGRYPAFDYFIKLGVNVIFAINGYPDRPTSSPVLPEIAELFTWTDKVHVVYGGTERNPYKARNVALGYAFHALELDGVFLTDSDCSFSHGLHEALLSCTQDEIVGGRTTTHIPVELSKHFRLMAGMECYENYEAPGCAYGCNMMIGHHVFDVVGSMRSHLVSRGDDDYTRRARDKGYPMRKDNHMHVVKSIPTLTFEGIYTKQFRRGKSGDPSFRQTMPEHQAQLKDAAKSLQVALESGSLNDPETYRSFIDALFKVGFELGNLSTFFDIKE